MKKTYQITEEGRKELEAELEELKGHVAKSLIRSQKLVITATSVRTQNTIAPAKSRGLWRLVLQRLKISW